MINYVNDNRIEIKLEGEINIYFKDKRAIYNTKKNSLIFINMEETIEFLDYLKDFKKVAFEIVPDKFYL